MKQAVGVGDAAFRQRDLCEQILAAEGEYVLSRTKADAARWLAIIRGHWSVIENGLPWVRDEVFREDRSSITTGHAPQNFAALRNAAIGCLHADGTDNLAATTGNHNASSPNSASCKKNVSP